MRILFLADSNSSHTKKWAFSLSKEGVEVGVFSLSKCSHPEEYEISGIKLFKSLELEAHAYYGGVASKLKYVSSVKPLKKVLEQFKPDILHAHYASSYGMIGALSGFHPYVISVWGSDVYEFPDHNMINKQALKFNLKNCDTILSTSNVMKLRTARFTSKPIMVTPFGINPEEFSPDVKPVLGFEGKFIIGIIKSMEDKYGIRHLIEAFSKVSKDNGSLPLHLLLVGGGSKIEAYKSLVSELGIADKVTFAGRIKHEDIPVVHQVIDIFVNPSTLESESFGVAVVEAMAMQKPVIVSEIGGLKDVVVDKISGLYVKPSDTDSLAQALQLLITNADLRDQLGAAARKRVLEHFVWNDTLNRVINDVYYPLMEGNKAGL